MVLIMAWRGYGAVGRVRRSRAGDSSCDFPSTTRRPRRKSALTARPTAGSGGEREQARPGAVRPGCEAGAARGDAISGPGRRSAARKSSGTGASKHERRARRRVRELEPPRVEHDARDRELADPPRSAVARVAEERRAEVGEVDADLVRAAGLGARLDERGARRLRAASRYAVAAASPLGSDAAQPGAARVLPERRVDAARRAATGARAQSAR